jgi:hypothetical protein
VTAPLAAAGAANISNASLPSALVEVEPDTSVVLAHASWGEEWRPLLRRFAEQARTMRPVQRISYEPLPLWMRAKVAWSKLRSGHEGHTVYTLTWHVPVNEILDGGLRREMLDFARAMYHYELPPGDAVILDRDAGRAGRRRGAASVRLARGARGDLRRGVVGDRAHRPGR